MIAYATLALAGLGVVYFGLKAILASFKSMGSADCTLDDTHLLEWQVQELNRLKLDYEVAEELGIDPVTLEDMTRRILAMEEDIAVVRARIEAEKQASSSKRSWKHEPVQEPQLVAFQAFNETKRRRRR